MKKYLEKRVIQIGLQVIHRVSINLTRGALIKVAIYENNLCNYS